MLNISEIINASKSFIPKLFFHFENKFEYYSSKKKKKKIFLTFACTKFIIGSTSATTKDPHLRNGTEPEIKITDLYAMNKN